MNFTSRLCAFKWGSAWEARGTGVLASAGSLCRQMRPQPGCHLAGASCTWRRLARLIKNCNLHENDKADCEETERVCPQPNPFCLSTFDLNSSRNAAPQCRAILKRSARRCQTWSVVALQVPRVRCITICTAPPAAPRSDRSLALLLWKRQILFSPFLSLFFFCSS